MHALLLGAVCIFVAGNWIWLGGGDHVYLNLEPYPDGLLYAVSAQQLVTHHKLALQYRDAVLPFWTAPLYSVVLSLFYLFSIRIETFYAANLVLGALGVLCFGAALNRFGLSKGTVAATLLLYVSHFYVYWIVSLPMAENLSLLLMNVLLQKAKTILLNVRVMK
jgi:hypothetical protein